MLGTPFCVRESVDHEARLEQRSFSVEVNLGTRDLNVVEGSNSDESQSAHPEQRQVGRLKTRRG